MEENLSGRSTPIELTLKHRLNGHGGASRGTLRNLVDSSDECDRYELVLGSPAQATILASATGFGPEYLMAREDLGTPMPNSDGPNRPDMVRADMVYIPIAGGGEIFSVGCIGFVGATAWNAFSNRTARLLDNVLAEFVARTDAARPEAAAQP